MKDHGSHDLASDYGAQRTGFKAYVHWDQKCSNLIITLRQTNAKVHSSNKTVCNQKHNYLTEAIPLCNNNCTIHYLGTAVAQWLRCCATNRKVAGSISAAVIGIFH